MHTLKHACNPDRLRQSRLWHIYPPSGVKQRWFSSLKCTATPPDWHTASRRGHFWDSVQVRVPNSGYHKFHYAGSVHAHEAISPSSTHSLTHTHTHTLVPSIECQTTTKNQGSRILFTETEMPYFTAGNISPGSVDFNPKISYPADAISHPYPLIMDPTTKLHQLQYITAFHECVCTCVCV